MSYKTIPWIRVDDLVRVVSDNMTVVGELDNEVVESVVPVGTTGIVVAVDGDEDWPWENLEDWQVCVALDGYKRLLYTDGLATGLVRIPKKKTRK